VKPYDIEVQRLKSMKHDKGVIEVDLDALVMARPARDAPDGGLARGAPRRQEAAREGQEGAVGSRRRRLSPTLRPRPAA